MEMHWSFECSNVLAPIVKAVAPHDQYRIWKKGSWLRMDSTITGEWMMLTTRGDKTAHFGAKAKHFARQTPVMGILTPPARARVMLSTPTAVKTRRV